MEGQRIKHPLSTSGLSKSSPIFGLCTATDKGVHLIHGESHVSTSISEYRPPLVVTGIEVHLVKWVNTGKGKVVFYSFIMQKSPLNIRKSRRLRTQANRPDIDRISALPDSVLCHILSYTPTKEAVATSLLARRWKNVWTALPNLSFDDRLCIQPPASNDVPMPGFVDFVTEVFRRTHPTRVAKFSLYCSRPTDLACVHDWVSAALMRDVAEIELNLRQANRVKLPESIYISTTLQVLRLHSDFLIKVPSVGTCFAGVKILSVHMQSPEASVAEQLFTNCPLVEELSINIDLQDDGPSPNLIIASTTLKRFQLTVRIEDNIFTETEYTLTITAPNLEWLHIVSDILGSYMVHELYSLKEVILDIFHGEWAQVDPYRALHLLSGINKTWRLTVSFGIIYAIHRACNSCLPSFPELIYLEVTVGVIGWAVLPIILRSSPIMETLVVHKQCRSDFSEDQFDWLNGQHVAHCLLHNVKNIVIKGVEGDEEDLALLEYLLKFTGRLEMMKIWFKALISKKERENLRQKILQLHGPSNRSKIEML